MRHLSGIVSGLGAVMLLAACNDTPPQDAGASNAASSPVTSDQGPTSAPSVAVTPRYVGRWAAAKTACGHEAWRFEDRRLSTPGEVGCEFKDVREAPGGYDVAAACLAEGESAAGELRLRFTDVTERMSVEGGPFSWNADLVYCGR